MVARYWQANTRDAIDARLTIENLPANSSGVWTLQRQNVDGSFSDVGSVPPVSMTPAVGAKVNGPSPGWQSTGVVTIPTASLLAWGWATQHFQWVIVAANPTGAAINLIEALSQDGTALNCVDGLANVYTPPVKVMPPLLSNVLTACPFTVRFP